MLACNGLVVLLLGTTSQNRCLPCQLLLITASPTFGDGLLWEGWTEGKR